MKKYTLSEAEKEWLGHTLHKVIYTDEWLKAREIKREDADGGWIEHEHNLSQDDDARVYGDARVSQGITTSMHIKTTEQWYEYQHKKAELQKKWDAEEGEEEKR